MNPAITKLIDQYLTGELSPEDQSAFETKLAESELLQEEVQLQQAIMEGIKRNHQRVEIQKIAKRYHLLKTIKWTGISILLAGALAFAISFLLSKKEQTTTDTEQSFTISESVVQELQSIHHFENVPVTLFSIPANGAVVLSNSGVLLSVPSSAFMKDGVPYTGNVIVHYQEAREASDILKSGLSTQSGDKLLETQGMFSVQGFTENGTALEFNPKVGVYVQVPVKEQLRGAQLFDGIVQNNGTIDWQSPEKLEKIPIPMDMSELNFYPANYETKLDALKWKRSKHSRDSLYLSFEEFGGNPSELHQVDQVLKPISESQIPTVKIFPQDASQAIADSTFATEAASIGFPHISPSNVLAFWNKKFNHTNLATREFESRMRAIHTTCNDAVLAKYTNNLHKSISAIDREVVKMGYGAFQVFVEENVGAVNPKNPHFAGLQKFYSEGIEALKKSNRRNQDAAQKQKQQWDEETAEIRAKEQQRSAKRTAESLQEETNYNLNSVYKQLGYTKGFTIRKASRTVTKRKTTAIRTGPAIKNIDAYVREATANRTSTVVKDPLTGKTVELTYNKFTLTVENAADYKKLLVYLFPHELHSYQRIDGANGFFSYPLNNALLYDVAVVGISEKGFAYFQKQTIRSGELGTISLKPLSEVALEACIQQLNSKRIVRPMPIGDELNWLMREKADYEEQEVRKKLQQFREEIARTIFPCYSDNLSVGNSNSEPFGI